jgi:hypothetical protein
VTQIWVGQIRGLRWTHWVRRGLLSGQAITLCAKRAQKPSDWIWPKGVPVTCRTCNAEARRQQLLLDIKNPAPGKP